MRLRSLSPRAWRARNPHHQGGDGCSELRKDRRRQSTPAQEGVWQAGLKERTNMVMKTSIRAAGTTRIVDVNGEIDLRSSASLREILFDSLEGTERLAVNLAATKYIDSSGIATLIEVLKEAQRRQKEFVL